MDGTKNKYCHFKSRGPNVRCKYVLCSWVYRRKLQNNAFIAFYAYNKRTVKSSRSLVSLFSSSSLSSSAEHDSTQAGHIYSRLNYVTLFVCFHCLTYKTTFFWPNDLIKSSYVILFAALLVWRSKWRMTFVLKGVLKPGWSPDTWKGFTAVLCSFRTIISLNKHVKVVKFGCVWLFTASEPLVSIITQNLS